MRHLLLLTLPMFFSFPSFAQCYTTHRDEGISLYQQQNWGAAKKAFETAKNCSTDIPASHDLEEWIGKCAGKLDSISTHNRGKGSIGNVPFPSGTGFSSRKIITHGKIADASDKEGMVVIDMCIDSLGIVQSAEMNKARSTTNDAALIEKALTAAKAYRFSRADAPRQCGSITFNFRLK
jgi:hypothetical protein